MDILELIENIDGRCKYRVHVLCVKELATIVADQNYDKALIRSLLSVLTTLSELGHNATHCPNFEKLKADDLYSAKVKLQKYNLRIIYSVSRYNIFLLFAFLERGGKSATDYSSVIRPSQSRLSELKNDGSVVYV